MTDAKAILEGLTEAQRHSILLARQNANETAMHLPRYRDAGKMRRTLFEAGVCNEYGRLNKTGIQVRALIEEQKV
mgnify:CR=1 FL=1